MNSKLLMPIGAFSAATQLSAKALRLYAEHGILLPTKIDSDSGYRYYRADQVHEARLIRLLRELEIPLSEIARILQTPDTIETELRHQMRFLAQRHRQQQTALHAALALLRSDAENTTELVTKRVLPSARIIVRHVAACSNTLLSRARLHLTELDQEIKHSKVIRGASFIHLPVPITKQEEISTELCVPIDASAKVPDGWTIRSWPTQTLACVEMPTPEEAPDWIAAADVLFDWFDRHGVALIHAPLVFFDAHPPVLAWPIA